MLASITAGAVAHVEGTQYAGVMLVDRRKKSTVSVAVTDPVMATLDDIQTKAGEAPCLEAA